MPTIESLESETVVKELLQTLELLPFIQDVRARQDEPTSDSGYRPDWHVYSWIRNEPCELLVEVKARPLYPRDVREIIWQLTKYAHFGTDRNRVPILAATSISKAARSLLEESGIGYFISGGTFHLSTNGTFIHIDRPTPKRAANKESAVFRGRTSDILRVLLANRGRWFGVNEIAEIANTAPSTASEALSLLEKKEWLDTRGAGPNKERTLRDESLVLDEWKDELKRRPPLQRQQFFVRVKSNAELCDKLFACAERNEATIALTSQTAADFYAPHLTSTPQIFCRAVPGAAFKAVIEDLGARSVKDGGNLIVIPTKSTGTFLMSEEHDGLTFVSPLQTYLDLLQSGGRSVEAAEHLRKVRLS